MRRLAPAQLVVSLIACDQGSGTLHGDWLAAPDCKVVGEVARFEPFDMSLAFASITEQQDAMLLRLSPSARQIHLSDQLVVTVGRTAQAGLDLVGTARGAPAVTLSLEPDGSGEADATLLLVGRCKHPTQSVGARGSVTFYEYGWQNGDHVRATVAFDLVDRRTGELAGEHFVGEFDFDAKTGSPHTAFSPRDY